MSLYGQNDSLAELLWDDELEIFGRARGGRVGAGRSTMRSRATSARARARSSRPAMAIPKALRPSLQQPGYLSQEGYSDEGYRSFAPAPYEAPVMDPEQIADMVMQEISGPATFGALRGPSRGRLSMDDEVTDELRPGRYGSSCYGCSSTSRYGEGVQVWHESKDWNAEHAATPPPAPAHSAFWESAKIGAGVGAGLLAVGVLAGFVSKAFR